MMVASHHEPPDRRGDLRRHARGRAGVQVSDVLGIAPRALGDRRRDVDDATTRVLRRAIAALADRERDLIRRLRRRGRRRAQRALAQRGDEGVVVQRATVLFLDHPARLEDRRVDIGVDLRAPPPLLDHRIARIIRGISRRDAGQPLLDLADRLAGQLFDTRTLRVRLRDARQLANRGVRQRARREELSRLRQLLQLLRDAQSLERHTPAIPQHPLHVLEEGAEPELDMDSRPLRDHQPVRLFHIEHRTLARDLLQRRVRLPPVTRRISAAEPTLRGAHVGTRRIERSIQHHDTPPYEHSF
jgi:hypothetical protein